MLDIASIEAINLVGKCGLMEMLLEILVTYCSERQS